MTAGLGDLSVGLGVTYCTSMYCDAGQYMERPKKVLKSQDALGNISTVLVRGIYVLLALPGSAF